METLKLALLFYVLISSTLGTYRLASIYASYEDEKISIYHIMDAFPKAIMFDWLLCIGFFISKLRK